jgi:hypothetical protein
MDFFFSNQKMEDFYLNKNEPMNLNLPLNDSKNYLKNFYLIFTKQQNYLNLLPKNNSKMPTLAYDSLSKKHLNLVKYVIFILEISDPKLITATSKNTLSKSKEKSLFSISQISLPIPHYSISIISPLFFPISLHLSSSEKNPDLTNYSPNFNIL